MEPFQMVIAVLLAAFVVYVIAANARAATGVEVSPEPTCESCGYNLRATPARCPECGAPVSRRRRPLDPKKLRDDWPDAPLDVREPAAGEPLVVLWDAPNSMAANLLIAQLAARGVRAISKSRQRPMRVGEYTPQGADVSVAVWSEDAERAEAILARFEPNATS